MTHLCLWLVAASRVSLRLETCQPPCLGLVAVDREGVVIASARMGDVVDAAAERPPRPCIENVESSAAHRPCRTGCSASPPAATPCSARRRRPCRMVSSPGSAAHCLLIACDRYSGRDRHRSSLHLHALGGRIRVAHRAADGTGFSQNVPGFERLPQSRADTPWYSTSPQKGKRNSRCASYQSDLQLEAVLVRRSREHFEEIGPDEMLEHEAVVQGRAPARQRSGSGTTSRTGRSMALQQHLLGKRSCARPAASRNRGTRRARGARSGRRANRACRCRFRGGGCLPVTSVRTLRNSRSGTHGSADASALGPGIWLRAISSS